MIVFPAAPSLWARPPVQPAIHARQRPLYRAQLAIDAAARRDAYRVRHDSYADGGYIARRQNGLFSDSYDSKPNAHTVVVYEKSVPIASVRVCLLVPGDDAAIPAQSLFPAIVESLVGKPGCGGGMLRAAEVNRLVRRPNFSNDINLIFLLYKLAGFLLLRNDIKLILSCARKNHIPFYRRLKFQEVSRPSIYPGLNCPMQMMALSRPNYDLVRPRPCAAGPGFRATRHLAALHRWARCRSALTAKS